LMQRQSDAATSEVFDSPQIKATPFPWHFLRLNQLFITSIISAYTFIFSHDNYVRDLLRHPSVNEYLSFIGGPPISPGPVWGHQRPFKGATYVGYRTVCSSLQILVT
jgi:hypothetical protein